jgi:hypothetical protein
MGKEPSFLSLHNLHNELLRSLLFFLSQQLGDNLIDDLIG